MARVDRGGAGEDGSAVTESVGELVVSVPSPRCDHRKHQLSALVEEILIDLPPAASAWQA